MRLGRGYSNITNTFTHSAISHDEATRTKITIPQSPTDFTVHTISDEHELRQLQKMSASLSTVMAQSGFSSSINASRDKNINGSSLHVIINLSAVVEIESITDIPSLNPDALTRLTNPNDGTETFIQVYGTDYISSVSLGRNMTAYIEFNTQKLATTSTVQASTTAGPAAVQLNMTAQNIMQEDNEHAVMKMCIHTNGFKIPETHFPKTLRELKAFLNEFSNPKNFTDRPAIIGCEYTPYSASLLQQQVPEEVISKFDTIRINAEKCFDTLIALKSNAIELLSKYNYHRQSLYGIKNPEMDDRLKNHPYTKKINELFSSLEKLIQQLDVLIETLTTYRITIDTINTTCQQYQQLQRQYEKIRHQLTPFLNYRMVGKYELLFKSGQNEAICFTSLMDFPPQTVFAYMIACYNTLEVTAALRNEIIGKDRVSLQVQQGCFGLCTTDITTSADPDKLSPQLLKTNRVRLMGSRFDTTSADKWTVYFFGATSNNSLPQDSKPAAHTLQTP